MKAKRPWTRQEATEKEKRLAESLETYLNLMDEGLGYVKGQPIVIWSDMDDEERLIVAQVLCRQATRNAEMAYLLDALMDEATYVEFAIIMAPRLWKTSKLFIPARRPRAARAPMGGIVDAAPAQR